MIRNRDCPTTLPLRAVRTTPRVQGLIWGDAKNPIVVDLAASGDFEIQVSRQSFQALTKRVVGDGLDRKLVTGSHHPFGRYHLKLRHFGVFAAHHAPCRESVSRRPDCGWTLETPQAVQPAGGR